MFAAGEELKLALATETVGVSRVKTHSKIYAFSANYTIPTQSVFRESNVGLFLLIGAEKMKRINAVCLTFNGSLDLSSTMLDLHGKGRFWL